MKTTVDIDDALLIAAKKKAAEQRRPLRALIEEGLRTVLRRPTAPRAKPIEWVVVEGGLPVDLPDLSDRAALGDWAHRLRTGRPSSASGDLPTSGQRR